MYRPLYLDYHALQTVPPSCINRDDTGSPKTARFGGVVRARISSQAWKKAIRDDFRRLLDEDDLALRTKHVVEAIARRIQGLDAGIDEDVATDLAKAALAATGIKVAKENLTGYLLFISSRQMDELARLAVEAHLSSSKVDAKAAKAALNTRERPSLNAVDIALFGRMVADAADLNCDAAVQVAHALGVGAAQTEFDYFTAMDDCSADDNSGAGMIGTVEFLSATLYRYATLDVAHLYENLGSKKATLAAIRAFSTAFARSMPTGKQNTFANRTLPAAVVIEERDTQPVSLANAFELPVYGRGDKSQMSIACERLVREQRCIDEAFGVTPTHAVVVVASPEAQAIKEIATETGSLDEMISSIVGRVSAYLDENYPSDGE